MLGAFAMTDASKVAEKLQKMKTGEDPLSYYKVNGERFNQAYDLLKKERIYLTTNPRNKLSFWIVRGNRKDYVVLANAPCCSCPDYYINVISGNAESCKHLIAVSLAQILYKYKIIRLNNEQYREFHETWKHSVSDDSESRFSFIPLSNTDAPRVKMGQNTQYSLSKKMEASR
jgi:predicted nucleic acid-binding Zn finger protein